MYGCHGDSMGGLSGLCQGLYHNFVIVSCGLYQVLYGFCKSCVMASTGLSKGVVGV